MSLFRLLQSRECSSMQRNLLRKRIGVWGFTETSKQGSHERAWVLSEGCKQFLHLNMWGQGGPLG